LSQVRVLPGEPHLREAVERKFGGFFCFGRSVAIDGEFIIVGARSDDDLGASAGSAYAYRFEGIEGVEEQKLLASDGAANDVFGSSVGVSDGMIVVGSPSLLTASPGSA
jgi:hypothetical protein